MNDVDLCIGCEEPLYVTDFRLTIDWDPDRGELVEKDASPIADLIARATDNAEEYKGQLTYKKR